MIEPILFLDTVCWAGIGLHYWMQDDFWLEHPPLIPSKIKALACFAIATLNAYGAWTV